MTVKYYNFFFFLNISLKGNNMMVTIHYWKVKLVSILKFDLKKGKEYPSDNGK